MTARWSSGARRIRLAARRASVLHLVDLKRADHTAAQTEFVISPGPVVHVAAQGPPRSLIGSQFD